MSIDHSSIYAAIDMLAPLYTETLIELGYQDSIKIKHNTHHPVVAVTEIIWIVLASIVLSPLNPLMWGLYFVAAALLGVLTTLLLGLGVVLGALLLVVGALIAVLFLAILSVVPIVLVLALGVLTIVAPLYFLFIIGDVIFTIVFVLTPTWLFTVAAFLFWISPPGLVTAALWLVIIFYVSWNYNGWNDTKDS
jgi:hypothetical protein